MKKGCCVLALILILFMLCSCGGYVNSYSAFLLITSSHGNEASMEFDTFQGSYNVKLKTDGNNKYTYDIKSSTKVIFDDDDDVDDWDDFLDWLDDEEIDDDDIEDEDFTVTLTLKKDTVKKVEIDS